MDFLDKLKSCIFEVNNLLSQYIEIHNKVLKSAGTFQSLFKKVDFQELHNDMGILLKDFASKDIEIGELRNEIYNSLTPPQKELFDCFSGYSGALLKTVNLLFKKVELLYNRSKNEGTLGWGYFSRISREYNESINDYLEFGKILNRAYKEIYE